MNKRLKNARGLYLITPDCSDTTRLCVQVRALLQQPIALLQYRHKTANKTLRRQQAKALQALTVHVGIPLIINDDWQLAMDIGADGVHLGAEDADPAWVRTQVGTTMLIGVSCYNDLQRAKMLSQCDVDYLAFGALFPSPSKPNARQAPLAVLHEARKFQKPIVAIGGISLENSADVIAAGADFIAVISGVFSATNPSQALTGYLNTFPEASL
jgi:thiamine-phosphate pyrophosphorylase